MPRDRKVTDATIVREAEEIEASTLAMSTEILPPDPAQQAVALQRMIESLVDRKVAEITGGADAIFQPFFQSKRIATAIKRLQTVDEQQKYPNYFADWGCLICETRETLHGSLGMCNKCYRNRVARMRATLRKNVRRQQDQPTFIDSMKLAREALEPSIAVLARVKETG